MANQLKPAANHPIYGTNGIMRRILMQGTAYVLDKDYPPIEAKRFGDNGLTNGDWWPVQVACKRDGAHEHHIRGVSSTPGVGVYSVIVGSGNNLDEGDRILYQPAIAKVTMEDQAAQVFLSNLQSHTPVRVIRAYTNPSVYAPRRGLRYDGLYLVRAMYEAELEGGTTIVVELERLGNQGDIDRSVPSYAQVQEYMRIRVGY